MTGQQYINELKTRLGRTYVNDNFSDLLLLSIVNQARRKVQLACLELMKDYFTTSIAIPFQNGTLNSKYTNLTDLQNENVLVYTFAMPDNFIDAVEVWIAYDNSQNYQDCLQCRIIAKNEFINTVKHTFNTSLTTQPIAYKEQNLTTTQHYLNIAIAEKLYNTANFASTANVIVFYLYLVDDLGIETTNVGGFPILAPPIENDPQMPINLEEIVILQSMVDLLSMTDKRHYWTRVKDELQMYYQLLEQNYELKKTVSSVIPSKMPLQGIPYAVINTPGVQNGMQKS